MTTQVENSIISLARQYAYEEIALRQMEGTEQEHYELKIELGAVKACLQKILGSEALEIFVAAHSL